MMEFGCSSLSMSMWCGLFCFVACVFFVPCCKIIINFRILKGAKVSPLRYGVDIWTDLTCDVMILLVSAA